MKNTPKTIPPLNEEIIGNLIKSAITSTLYNLKELPVPEYNTNIHALNFDGSGEQELPTPDYRLFTAKDLKDLWRSDASLEWSSYLRNTGEFEKHLPKNEDGTLADWAYHFWVLSVFHPLISALKIKAISSLATTKTYTPWNLSADEIEELAKELARIICKSGQKILAIGHIGNIKIDTDTTKIDLGLGATISTPSPGENCVFFSLFGGEDAFDEKMPHLDSNVFFKMENIYPYDSITDASIATAAMLDRFKWALMITKNKFSPPPEGTIYFHGPTGWRGNSLKRRFIRNRDIPPSIFMNSYTLKETRFHISKKDSEEINEKLRLIAECELTYPEMKNAIWHLGRACNCILLRDALLEATIGLESLLVSGHGELSYKLSLHCTTILGATAGNNVAKEIKDIYSLRSRIAHGHGFDEDEKSKRLTDRAKELLARSIFRACILIKKGTLNKNHQRNTTLGDSINQFLIEKAAGLAE